MCKNNFTNENEFDFSGVMPDSVYNPCGSFNGCINERATGPLQTFIWPDY